MKAITRVVSIVICPRSGGEAPASCCAVRFPDGLSAKVNSGTSYKDFDSREMEPRDMASSVWDLLSGASSVQDTTITIFGLPLDMEQAERGKARSWWTKAPTPEPPRVHPEQLERANGKESLTNFRNELIGSGPAKCAATGLSIRHRRELTKLDAVHAIELSTGYAVYDKVVFKVFDSQRSDDAPTDQMCRPLFSKATCKLCSRAR